MKSRIRSKNSKIELQTKMRARATGGKFFFWEQPKGAKKIVV